MLEIDPFRNTSRERKKGEIYYNLKVNYYNLKVLTDVDLRFIWKEYLHNNILVKRLLSPLNINKMFLFFIWTIFACNDDHSRFEWNYNNITF